MKVFIINNIIRRGAPAKTSLSDFLSDRMDGIRYAIVFKGKSYCSYYSEKNGAAVCLHDDAVGFLKRYKKECHVFELKDWTSNIKEITDDEIKRRLAETYPEELI